MKVAYNVYVLNMLLVVEVYHIYPFLGLGDDWIGRNRVKH